MITKHANQNSVGFSNQLWKNCPFLGIGGVPLLDPDTGKFTYRNWSPAPNFTSGTSQMGLHPIMDTGCTLTNGDGGVLLGTFDGTDEDEIYLVDGNVGGWILGSSATAASRKSWWFETRHKISQVASMAMFIGLCDAAAGAADALVDATGALVDDDFVGFQIISAGFTAVNAVWKKGGQTQGAPTDAAAIHTMVADTYVRLGMWYDAPSDMLRWYVDGVEKCSQKIASATQFPVDVWMSPALLHKVTAATASTFSNHWMAGAIAA